MNAYSAIVLDRAGRFTAEDYARMIDAGVFGGAPVELIEGKLCKMSPAHTRHALAHGDMAGLLHAAIAGTGLRLLLDAATRIGPDTVCAPDIALVQRAPADDGLLNATAVLLAVEIGASTLEEDLALKPALYARAGIPHLWVVDAASRGVHLFARPGRDGYADVRVVAAGSSIAVPGTDAVVTLG